MWYEPSAKLFDSVALRRTILSWPLKIVQHGRHQFSNAAVVATSALACSAGEKPKVAARKEMLLIRDTSRWWKSCQDFATCLVVSRSYKCLQLSNFGKVELLNCKTSQQKSGYIFAAPEWWCQETLARGMLLLSSFSWRIKQMCPIPLMRPAISGTHQRCVPGAPEVWKLRDKIAH